MKSLSAAQMHLSRFGGMSEVITLRDKGFIIVDGGQALMFYKEHSETLYNYLKKRSPDEKPLILGWFFTHFHSDHTACAAEFLLEYKDLIDVKGFYYNDPGVLLEKLDIEKRELLEKAMNAYPHAVRHLLKTHETLSFPHCNAQILHTTADEAREYISCPNVISAIIRFSFDTGKAFLVHGDCEITTMNRLIDENDKLYIDPKLLKSEVIQVTHHGRTSGSMSDRMKTIEYYKTVDPTVCFYPIHKESFETDPIYTSDDYADNVYLIKNTKCFHHSETVSVDMDDLFVKIE